MNPFGGLLAVLLLAGGVASSAATPAASPSKSATRAQAAKPQAAPQARAYKPVAATTPAPLPEADEAQRAAAEQTHFGEYACEFGEQVRVQRNARHEGYVDVQHRKATWTMKPVLSQTGALRLEDIRGRTLMLQIANKSMLMDSRIGQRLVDNCVHDNQRHVAPHPPEQSLGIDPSRNTAAAPPS